MRVSCAVPKGLCSVDFLSRLDQLGVKPIITQTIIRVVYEGEDHALGTKIVEEFMYEVDHDITVDYCDEKPKPRKKKRH